MTATSDFINIKHHIIGTYTDDRKGEVKKKSIFFLSHTSSTE